MRFYLASSFSNIERVQEVCDLLEDHGHTITEKWWCRPYQVEGLGEVATQELKKLYENLSPDEYYSKPETEASFWMDFKGVLNAEALIIVATDTPRKYNGSIAEYGIALGVGIPVAVLGQLETSVLYWPLTRVSCLETLMDWVRVVDKLKRLEVSQ